MAYGGGLDDSAEVVSEINMTPLVDVMLVLLITTDRAPLSRRGAEGPA